MAFERITPRYVDGRKLTDAEISLLISKILGNEEYVAALKPPIIANLKSEGRERRLNGLLSVSKYEKYLEHTMANGAAESHVVKPPHPNKEAGDDVQAAHRIRAQKDRETASVLAARTDLPPSIVKKLRDRNIGVVRKGIAQATPLVEARVETLRTELLKQTRDDAEAYFTDKLGPLCQYASTHRAPHQPTQQEKLSQFIDSVEDCWNDCGKLRNWIKQAERWVEKLEARKQRAEQKASRPTPELPAPQAGKVDWVKQDQLKSNVATKAYCQSRTDAGTPSRGKAVANAGKSQKQLAAKGKK